MGPRRRISDKLASFGHAHEVADHWIEDVWDRFDPSMENFNPAYPDVLRGVRGDRARGAAARDPRASLAGGVPVVTSPVECTLVVVAYHRPASLRRLLDGLDAPATLGLPSVVVNVEADAEVTVVARDFGATEVDGPESRLRRGGEPREP